MFQMIWSGFLSCSIHDACQGKCRISLEDIRSVLTQVLLAEQGIGVRFNFRMSLRMEIFEVWRGSK
jgi:hypothetical protein